MHDNNTKMYINFVNLKTNHFKAVFLIFRESNNKGLTIN